jgi:hypothetical protein
MALTIASSEWVEIPEIIGVSLYLQQLHQLVVVKGAGHKYIRRVPYAAKGGKTRYRYYYNVRGAKGAGHEDEIKAGSAFKIKHGEHEGHFHVEAVDGDHVTVVHDESGHSVKMPKRAFAEMIREEHAEAIREHHAAVKEEHAKTTVPGMRKQVERRAAKYGVELVVPKGEAAEKDPKLAPLERADLTKLVDNAETVARLIDNRLVGNFRQAIKDAFAAGEKALRGGRMSPQVENMKQDLRTIAQILKVHDRKPGFSDNADVGKLRDQLAILGVVTKQAVEEYKPGESKEPKFKTREGENTNDFGNRMTDMAASWRPGDPDPPTPGEFRAAMVAAGAKEDSVDRFDAPLYKRHHEGWEQSKGLADDYFAGRKTRDEVFKHSSVAASLVRHMAITKARPAVDEAIVGKHGWRVQEFRNRRGGLESYLLRDPSGIYGLHVEYDPSGSFEGSGKRRKWKKGKPGVWANILVNSPKYGWTDPSAGQWSGSLEDTMREATKRADFLIKRDLPKGWKKESGVGTAFKAELKTFGGDVVARARAGKWDVTHYKGEDDLDGTDVGTFDSLSEALHVGGRPSTWGSLQVGPEEPKKISERRVPKLTGTVAGHAKELARGSGLTTGEWPTGDRKHLKEFAGSAAEGGDLPAGVDLDVVKEMLLQEGMAADSDAKREPGSGAAGYARSVWKLRELAKTMSERLDPKEPSPTKPSGGGEKKDDIKTLRVRGKPLIETLTVEPKSEDAVQVLVEKHQPKARSSRGRAKLKNKLAALLGHDPIRDEDRDEIVAIRRAVGIDTPELEGRKEELEKPERKKVSRDPLFSKQGLRLGVLGLGTQRIGRRTYVLGSTYEHMGKLRNAGMKWDPDRGQWWGGDHDKVTSVVDERNRNKEELVSLTGGEPEPADSAESLLEMLKESPGPSQHQLKEATSLLRKDVWSDTNSGRMGVKKPTPDEIKGWTGREVSALLSDLKTAIIHRNLERRAGSRPVSTKKATKRQIEYANSLLARTSASEWHDSDMGQWMADKPTGVEGWGREEVSELISDLAEMHRAKTSRWGKSFTLTHGDNSGSFRIVSDEGNDVVIEHDESGHSVEMTKSELRHLLKLERLRLMKGRRDALAEEASS